MESKNNNGNLKIILLVAFIVVALVISGFIVYDKFIKEDAPVVNNGVENKPIDGEKEVTVVSAYKFDGKAKYTGTCSDFGAVNMNVNIPKIDSNKANAVALNNKIMKDYGRFANLEKGTVYRNVVVNYTESIKDGIMTIVISATGEFPCGSGVQEKRTYSYDITKDTILDNGTEKPYEDKNPINNENANVNNNNNNNNNSNNNNNNNNVDNNDNSVIEKGEIITELELISDEDENTRRVYLNEGNVICSDCNTLSIGNNKVISLNYAYSCAGNYNIYYLLDNGQVYVNDENVQRFFKLGAVEVKTSEKIVGMQSYSNGSNSCGARDVYFIGESGNKYKASLSCNNGASHVVKAELVSYTSQVDGSCKNVK